MFSVIVTPDFVGGGFRVASSISLGLFSMVIALVFVSLFSPRGFKKAVTAIATRIPRLGRMMERRDITRRLFETVDRYHDLMTSFVLRNPLIIAGGVFLSALIYMNKFTIAWVVLRGLGLEASFWDVMYMQVVLILIFYFSPTPGASGLAEVSTAAIMGTVVPTNYQGVFILLWRFFTLVAGMFIGALVVARYFTGLWGRQKKPRD